MAIDGTGVFASDLAHDVQTQIRNDWDAGIEADALRARLSSIATQVDDDLEREIFLAASTSALWEIGELDAARVEELRALLVSERSLVLWSDAAGSAAARMRGMVLRKLLAKVAIPKAKPTKRAPIPSVETQLYAVGDCAVWTQATGTLNVVCCRVALVKRAWMYLFLVMEPGIPFEVAALPAARYYGSRTNYGIDSGKPGVDMVMLSARDAKRADSHVKKYGSVELEPSAFGMASMSGNAVHFSRRTNLLPLAEILVHP